MKVYVRIIGALIRPDGRSDFECELSDETVVGSLLNALGYQQHHLPHIMAVVNGVTQSHDHILEDKDEIVLSLPIGGG